MGRFTKFLKHENLEVYASCEMLHVGSAVHMHMYIDILYYDHLTIRVPVSFAKNTSVLGMMTRFSEWACVIAVKFNR